MKKCLSILIALVLLAGFLFACGGTAFGENTDQSAGLPTAWNLSDLFESEEAWYAAYDRASALADTFGQYRGTLHTAEGLLQYIQAVYDGEYEELLTRLSTYAEMKSTLNSADPLPREMQAKLSVLQEKAASLTAYEETELFELSLEEREALFADPLLEGYAYSFRSYTDEKTVHYSEETNIALAKAQSSTQQSYTTYQILLNSEQPYSEVTLPDGTVQTADYALYNQVMHGDSDQQTKLTVAEAYFGSVARFANTYTSLLNTNALDYLAMAKLNGFDNVLEYSLNSDDVNREIYDRMKETVYAMLPAYHQYLEQRKQSQGLEHMYYTDLLAASVKNTRSYTYDEACNIMLEALSLLGEDYLSEVRQVLEKAHVDVYPSSGKETGAFEISCYQSSVYPYILLNFSESYDDISTLCHEMGHAMYARFSEKNPALNIRSNGPAIFTHEVASTTNELLLALKMLDQAESTEERQYYLENLIDLICSTVIRQVMYSEFEEYIYSLVEAGSSLSAEGLCAKWMELSRKYYGDAVEFPKGYEYRWLEIPHFYYGYYVYKYATSLTYAAAISQKLYYQEPGALEAYQQFLELGSSASPSELLKIAGVDTGDSATYQYIVDFFASLVSQVGDLR